MASYLVTLDWHARASSDPQHPEAMVRFLAIAGLPLSAPSLFPAHMQVALSAAISNAFGILLQSARRCTWLHALRDAVPGARMAELSAARREPRGRWRQ
jgi:hypothetical protein